MFCCLYHTLKYLDLRPTLKIDTYMDNQKVIQYFLDIQQKNNQTVAFIDDMDLKLLLALYYNHIVDRGVQFPKPQKIVSQKKQQPNDLPHTLHQQMDKIAKLT